ncbi:hypothetical protein KP509_19G049900 [Ceratopteris richardii]|uniref:Uncharacterized protein n=1 Tax=Ceratopteris richardii TaxID=49495 RepID=A0A8T2SK31_CERRI|nr:hypothetical protein KP509_19G049900 [Ceratopteris richardii]KAH7352526.1 hypothetical protein KP509_19G049900 [Ceratopteris richardii]
MFAPLDDVQWIECESKGDSMLTESEVLRRSSCSPEERFQRTVREVPEQEGDFSQKVYQRLRKTETRPKSGAVKEDAKQRNFRVKEGAVTFHEGDWYEDPRPENSLPSVPLDATIKSCSASRNENGSQTKKDVAVYSFEGGDMCKVESSYRDDGTEIVNNSCHFLLTDMCPPGDLEFLSEVQEEARRENLLEFGWGNTNQLEDIDKLFTVDNDTGMLWDPPSPTLGDSLRNLEQPVSEPVSPEFISAGGAKGFEDNENFSMRKNSEKHAGSEQWKDSSHDGQESVPNLDDSRSSMQVNNFTDCSRMSNQESEAVCEERMSGAECVKSEGVYPAKDSNKAGTTVQFGSPQTDDENIHAVREGEKWKEGKGKRHGQRNKRMEDNSRRITVPCKKMALNLSPANVSPLLYVPVVPVAQEPPSSLVHVSRPTSSDAVSTMQCLQPVPYVHAGFGFPAHHHLPVVVPTSSMMSQQPQPQQPVFMSYPPPFLDVAKYHQSSGTFDVSSQSRTTSSTMTPQEKIEKLRWRQKMQARLAVEQQQQQLINQRLIPEKLQFEKSVNSQLNSHRHAVDGTVSLAQTQNPDPLSRDERSLPLDGPMVEDGDESLSATVLHQLLSIASKMDTRTRLCLRDGFHRLARNALQRRNAGESRGSKRENSEHVNRSCTVDSSSSSDQSCSQRRLWTVDDIVETETNPMDRFIAHLLFHKRFTSSHTPGHINHAPLSNTEGSYPSTLQHKGWALNDEKDSHSSPVAKSSSITDGGGFLKGMDAIPGLPSTNLEDEKPNIHSKQTVSSVKVENGNNPSAAPTMDALQTLLEDGASMSETDPSLCPSKCTNDNPGEIA